jgi:uncharacterized membrane protein (Fun14 family)
LSFETLTPLAAQLGFGGLSGLVVGYAFKKLLKILVVLVGLFFVALMYLAYVDFIEINYDKISRAFQGLISSLQTGDFTLPTFITSNVPFAGSFVVGFGIGFKMG